MDPRIRRVLEPVRRLRREIGVPEELASVEQIAAHVADRPLDFAFGLGPVGPTGPDAKAPMRGATQELRILEQLAPVGTVVLEEDALHLIEEELGRDATEVGEGRFQPRDHRGHRLAGIEAEPEESGVAEDHEQGVTLPPGKAALRKIDLGLVARRRFEADHRLGLRTGTHPGHVVAELRDPTRVARGADLLEEPDAAELRIRREAGADDRLVGGQAGGPSDPDAAAAPRQIAVHLPGRDPVVDEAPADAQLPGNGGFGQALVQQVFE